MRLVPFLLLACACASRPKNVHTAPEQTTRPHVPEIVAEIAPGSDKGSAKGSIGCAKTSTRISVGDAWRLAAATEQDTLVMKHASCRAVLIVRASHVDDRGSDFDRAFLIGESIAGLPSMDALRAEAREMALAKGRTELKTPELFVAYELDELASLTCSVLVVGEAACFLESTAILATLTRAPAALRAPAPKPNATPVRNMGPYGPATETPRMGAAAVPARPQ